MTIHMPAIPDLAHLDLPKVVSILLAGVAGLLGLLVLKTLLTAFYNLTFHPLAQAKIPGPWYAKINSWYHTYYTLKNSEVEVLHSLFEKYGPIVRVAPNIVAFVDPDNTDATALVYGMKSVYPKSYWYQSLVCDDRDCAISMLQSDTHNVRIKAYGDNYAPTTLVKYQTKLHDYTLAILSRLQHAGGKSAQDTFPLFESLMVDAIVVNSVGPAAIASANSDSQFLQATMDWGARSAIRWLVGNRLLNLSYYLIPSTSWKAIVNADAIISKWARDRIGIRKAEINDLQAESRRSSQIKTGPGPVDELPPSLADRLLKSPWVQFEETVSEVVCQLIAGASNMAVTMTLLLYTLAKRPDIIQKLRDELNTVMPPTNGGDPTRLRSSTIPDISVLNELPYLNAVVKEALRLYTAAPGRLPRDVPEGRPVKIQGYQIPSGTTIETQAWTTHRDPSAFPDPEEFKPERWFNETEEMKRRYFPMGIGQRRCAGYNLVQLMYRIAVAGVAANFDIKIAPGTDDSKMKMGGNILIAFPGPCMLYFTPAPSSGVKPQLPNGTYRIFCPTELGTKHLVTFENPSRDTWENGHVAYISASDVQPNDQWTIVKNTDGSDTYNVWWRNPGDKKNLTYDSRKSVMYGAGMGKPVNWIIEWDGDHWRFSPDSLRDRIIHYSGNGHPPIASIQEEESMEFKWHKLQLVNVPKAY